MLWKCCTQYASKFGKLHRTGKGQFSFQSKKDNAKKCSNYCTIALISHASKVMLKILQARLQQHVNHELPDVQAGFRKGRGTRDQIGNICWIMEKARVTELCNYATLQYIPEHRMFWTCRAPCIQLGMQLTIVENFEAFCTSVEVKVYYAYKRMKL